MRDRRLQLLAGAVLAGAALRFATLDTQSFWLDEAVTATLLDQGLGGVLSDLPDSESTPPLYYVLAWLWSRPFGLGEVGLRSLSALIGTATIPVAYIAARSLASTRVALVAAWLAATSPLLVWYSQEARAYALLVLLTAAMLALLPRAGARRALYAWGAVAALALATHYFALFVVGPQAAWLLWRHGRRALPAVAMPAAAGAALLPLALHQESNDAANFIEGSSLSFRLAQVPKQVLAGFDAPAETALAALAVLLALVGVALLAMRADGVERRGAAAAAAVAACAIGIPAVLAIAGPDFLITRNAIAGVLPLLVALAAGLGAKRAGHAGVAAAAGLCALWTVLAVWVAAEPRFQRDDWRGAAESLGAPPVGGRIVVVQPSEGAIALRVYLRGVREVTRDGATVGEQAVIGLAPRRAGEDPEPPRGPSTPPPGIPSLVARTDAPTFTTLVWRAPEAAHLFPGAAETAKLVQAPAAVLFEPARR